MGEAKRRKEGLTAKIREQLSNPAWGSGNEDAGTFVKIILEYHKARGGAVEIPSAREMGRMAGMIKNPIFAEINKEVSIFKTLKAGVDPRRVQSGDYSGHEVYKADLLDCRLAVIMEHGEWSSEEKTAFITGMKEISAIRARSLGRALAEMGVGNDLGNLMIPKRSAMLMEMGVKEGLEGAGSEERQMFLDILSASWAMNWNEPDKMDDEETWAASEVFSKYWNKKELNLTMQKAKKKNLTLPIGLGRAVRIETGALGEAFCALWLLEAGFDRVELDNVSVGREALEKAGKNWKEVFGKVKEGEGWAAEDIAIRALGQTWKPKSGGRGKTDVMAWKGEEKERWSVKCLWGSPPSLLNSSGLTVINLDGWVESEDFGEILDKACPEGREGFLRAVIGWRGGKKETEKDREQISAAARVFSMGATPSGEVDGADGFAIVGQSAMGPFVDFAGFDSYLANQVFATASFQCGASKKIKKTEEGRSGFSIGIRMSDKVKSMLPTVKKEGAARGGRVSRGMVGQAGNVESGSMISENWGGGITSVRFERRANNRSRELIAASRKNDVREVVRLLKHGVNPSISDTNGFTPLMAAASSGAENTLGMLLDMGADVDGRDYVGLSALMQAASRGNTGCVEMLLAAGAKKNARDFHGLTAKDMARDGKTEELLGRKGEKKKNKSYTKKFVRGWAVVKIEGIWVLLERGGITRSDEEKSPISFGVLKDMTWEDWKHEKVRLANESGAISGIQIDDEAGENLAIVFRNMGDGEKWRATREKAEEVAEELFCSGGRLKTDLEFNIPEDLSLARKLKI